MKMHAVKGKATIKEMCNVLYLWQSHIQLNGEKSNKEVMEGRETGRDEEGKKEMGGREGRKVNKGQNEGSKEGRKEG